jgi:(p)ppGpp synthase/HD superfamily hydrolase
MDEDIIRKIIIKNSIAEKAFHFAQERHKGQLDNDGNDYFQAHIVNVADIIINVTTDPEIISVTYLHDILEDTDTTFNELNSEFGLRIANLVFQVTHIGTNDSIGYSFPNLKDRDAIMIKFADRLSNISRMDSWDEKRKAHYLKQSVFWRTNERNGNGDK